MRQAVPTYVPPPGHTLDLYGILEIQPEAGLYDIEAAYSRLSGEWGRRLSDIPAEARFRIMVLNQAYDTLTSPQRRREYDSVVFKDQRQEEERAVRKLSGRETRRRRLLMAAVASMVLFEGAFLALTWTDQISI